MPLPLGWCDTGIRFNFTATADCTLNTDPCGDGGGNILGSGTQGQWPEVTAIGHFFFRYADENETNLDSGSTMVEAVVNQLGFDDRIPPVGIPPGPPVPTFVAASVRNDYRGAARAIISENAGPYWVIESGCGDTAWYVDPAASRVLNFGGGVVVTFPLANRGTFALQPPGYDAVLEASRRNAAPCPGFDEDGIDFSADFATVTWTDNVGYLDARECGDLIPPLGHAVNTGAVCYTPGDHSLANVFGNAAGDVSARRLGHLWQFFTSNGHAFSSGISVAATGRDVLGPGAYCPVTICVTDECTGLPLAGANVEITVSCPPSPYHNHSAGTFVGDTGADGCVTLDYVGPNSTYRVTKHCYVGPDGTPGVNGIIAPCGCGSLLGAEHPFYRVALHPLLRFGALCGPGHVVCACPEGTVLDVACNVCRPTCGPCEVWQHCRCETISTTCPGNQVFDHDTCACACPDGTFLCHGLCIHPPPRPPCFDALHCFWDPTICNWSCDTPHIACQAERGCTWNSTICDWCCNKADPVDNGCPPNFHWDTGLQDCIRNVPGGGCPPGWTWDPVAGDCVATTTVGSPAACAAGCTFNATTFACHCELCPGSDYWDSVTGQCESSAPGSKRCPPGQSWNDDCQLCTSPLCSDPADTWDTSTCSCHPACPPGLILCNGDCIPEPPHPDCFSELHCHWDTTTCNWVCDDPVCPAGQGWVTAVCHCEPVPPDSSFELDAAINNSGTLKYVFRREAPEDPPDPAGPPLVIDAFVIVPGPPLSWLKLDTQTVIDHGLSPSIIPMRDDGMSLAYVAADGSTSKVYSAVWVRGQGKRKVQEVGNGARVTHTRDIWSRVIWAIHDGIDWSVCVGKLASGGGTFATSSLVRMVDKHGNPMSGLPSQAAIEGLSDGSVMFTYPHTDGSVRHVRCRVLSNAGVGSWN